MGKVIPKYYSPSLKLSYNPKKLEKAQDAEKNEIKQVLPQIKLYPKIVSLALLQFSSPKINFTEFR